MAENKASTGKKRATTPASQVKPARKRGQPSKFTPELMDEICERVSNGEPLRQICRDEHMPHWNTVYDWIENDKELTLRFARAREKGEEAIAAECLDIADNGKNDWMEKHGKDSVGYELNKEHVQRSKLRIETRLKLLAKWNPKKWGEKVDVNHGGQEGNPIKATTKVVIVPSKATADVVVKAMGEDAK